MSNYVKKYNLGNIIVDLPYNSYIHELPLLSFSDYRNSVNISLVFNKRLESIDTAACSNTFNIKEGYKLNIQKKVYLDDNDNKYKYIDYSGKVITLINNGEVYTFDDDSKRILKVISSGYIVENYDFSKEEFNNNGLLSKVYDKYGDLYLAYTYNSNNLLASVTYNGKTVMFSYASNVLNEISYEDTTTEITYEGNILTVEHYNHVVYVCSITGNDYVVEAKPSKNSITEYMKTCLFENNTIKLTEKIGTETIDSITYTFPQVVTGSYKDYKQVEITNVVGAKQRIQFKDKKPIYSYTINSENLFFNNEGKYPGTVQIYNTDNEFKNKAFKGYIGLYDGIIMGENSYLLDEWSVPTSLFKNKKGYYMISGWVKSSGPTTGNLVITSSLQDIDNQFNIAINELNKWQFFSLQFDHNADTLIVIPQSTTGIEYCDLRLTYHSSEIYDQTKNSNCLYTENIIFSGSQRIPFDEVSFVYTKDDEKKTINNITLSDVLKYKLELIKGIQNSLLYYNDCKNIIDGVTNLEVLYNGQYIDIDDISIGTRYYSKGKEYYTKISKSGMTASPIIISNQLGNSTKAYSYQYLNEYLDALISHEDGITVNYTRDKGLITQETLGSLYNIVTTYTPTMITVRDTLASGVKYVGIKYYIDSVWGTITKTEYSDETIIEDTYDGDMSTIKKKTFKKNSNQNIINFGYTNELLTSLTNGTLNYEFGYNDNNKKLELIKKFGSVIEEQEHEHRRNKFYFPNENNEVYSKEYKYNKYGYLSEITNELENIYLNDSLLSKTIDKILNLEENYEYDTDSGNLISISIAPTNTSNNNTVESFEYDKENRLTSKEFKYNINPDKSVKDKIVYVKNEDDVVKDQRLSETVYYINNSEVLNTINQYDSYKRLTKKTYLFDLGSEEEYSKRFTYTNNKLYKVKNEKDEEVVFNYDSHERINSIQNIDKLCSYEYDSFGRLIRENNEPLDKTIVYSYNDIGNIISKKEYSYTTVEDITITPSKTINYTYDTVQKDRLITFDTTTIPYNTLGCPTKYKGYDLTWNKGKLTGLSKGTIDTELESISYTYNAYGQRVSKSQYKTKGFNAPTQFLIGELIEYNKEYKYDNSGRLIREVTTNTYYQAGTGTEEIIYIYDLNTIIGMKYTVGNNSNIYYFDRNVLGDVEAIYDLYGNLKVKYSYDAYGNCTVSSETTDTNLARVNPIRYRGYYYDVETNLFLVSSRYYSPELCRWISPDDIEYLDPESVNGLNLYCYCLNNPIMYTDPTGHFAISTFLIGLAVSAVVGWGLSEIFGTQIAGGIGSVTGGATAISTGMSLCAFGPWCIAAGVVLMAVGGLTIAFGANEIVDGATGTNYIQEWTGWSDDLYNGVYIGLNVASAVGSIAGNIGMKIASNNILNNIVKNPQNAQNYKLWQMKTFGRYTTQYVPGTLQKGTHIGQGYTLTNIGGGPKGYIQWHPGSRHHFGGAPYWKVTSALGGTWRGLYLF